MPKFTYTAIQSDGQRVSGTIESFSLQAAHDALKQMHLVPEELHESLVSEQPLTPEHAEKLLTFTPAVPVHEASASPAEHPAPQSVPDTPATEAAYFPLLDTLRLYAGWLLAWYAFVYALGNYQHTRPLPFRIPFVEGLFLSPLVFSFTLGAYLFLLLSGIWKASGKGLLKGFFMTAIGVTGFVLYRMNVL
ncbi:MAG: hypothetical protein PHX87_06400 [Candidatus Peribacteraceae bacterium]|nr:hypothetical protein [Candidatus Peribacteraceae bacterium]MDD5743020.1 hypothetical protein [Candidatus Peribacteraceae bacterium]